MFNSDKVNLLWSNGSGSDNLQQYQVEQFYKMKTTYIHKPKLS